MVFFATNEGLSLKSINFAGMDATTHYKYNPTEEERLSIFIASCIESAAEATGTSSEAMYQRMQRIGLIKDYIVPCYNVLHAESRQNVTEDILKTIAIWEKKEMKND